jgi:hypothetical protein
MSSQYEAYDSVMTAKYKKAKRAGREVLRGLAVPEGPLKVARSFTAG